MNKIRDNSYIKAFGYHLRELRTKKELSQEELAYSADIPISQIGRIERGEVNTTISTINALAKALNDHPKVLLDFKV
ncbi:MAG: helix-turn-helix transcriptional regulator [Flavobacteriales bacterium]|nr:helix-turn-helix transcriptional regulator [Flavobacteriales bacterium]